MLKIYNNPNPQPIPITSLLASIGVFADKIINNGYSKISGSIAVCPNIEIHGFPPGKVFGQIFIGIDNLRASAAKNDLKSAYINASKRRPTTILSYDNLGGKTLTPGVYKFKKNAYINGELTLNGANTSNACFIFQCDSLITSKNSIINLVNAAVASRIFWKINNNTHINSNSIFYGSIITKGNITADYGSNISGSLWSISGNVTLHNVNIRTQGLLLV